MCENIFRPWCRYLQRQTTKKITTKNSAGGSCEFGKVLVVKVIPKKGEEVGLLILKMMTLIVLIPNGTGDSFLKWSVMVEKKRGPDNLCGFHVLRLLDCLSVCLSIWCLSIFMLVSPVKVLKYTAAQLKATPQVSKEYMTTG